jgi:hypothetical protein
MHREVGGKGVQLLAGGEVALWWLRRRLGAQRGPLLGWSHLHNATWGTRGATDTDRASRRNGDAMQKRVVFAAICASRQHATLTYAWITERLRRGARLGRSGSRAACCVGRRGPPLSTICASAIHSPRGKESQSHMQDHRPSNNK